MGTPLRRQGAVVQQQEDERPRPARSSSVVTAGLLTPGEVSSDVGPATGPAPSPTTAAAAPAAGGATAVAAPALATPGATATVAPSPTTAAPAAAPAAAGDTAVAAPATAGATTAAAAAPSPTIAAAATSTAGATAVAAPAAAATTTTAAAQGVAPSSGKDSDISGGVSPTTAADSSPEQHGEGSDSARAVPDASSTRPGDADAGGTQGCGEGEAPAASGEKATTGGQKGAPNGANLCCVNAVVQLLRHCPQLREGLAAYLTTPLTTSSAGTSSTGDRGGAAKNAKQKAAAKGVAAMTKLVQGQQGDAHLVLIKLLDAFSEASEGDEGADMLKKAMVDMTPVVASEHVCSCGHVSEGGGVGG
ncbi:hypothetical protein Esi_0028_0114 [Ectocarpus siliculosus]|uniref:USP domain-containing protein n=1 Tax=Ectocarpus siliculosus TaxID=2880 RepID=D8LK33_ECTSI|nr:hypothetical protein Esi_0028_0114 [Ectocarpus siliculosus]|eukprot:CBN74502.1 hypothetical protein Esi_0028_0114 [Ectocarpus siliculosus]